jgi:hypothetical protein
MDGAEDIPQPNPLPSRRRWKSLVGLALSVLLVVLLVWTVDLREAWRAILRMDHGRLWLPALLIALGLTIRPYRWQLIFPPHHRPMFGRAFVVWSIANMSNNVLPARGGDVLRCFLIARGQPMRLASTALATLGMEKVLDGLALLAVIVLAFWFVTPPGWLQALTFVAALIFVGALAVMILLQRSPAWIERMVLGVALRLRRPALGRKIIGLLRSFADGLHAVRSPRQMGVLVGLTTLTWFIEVALVWACARALGLPIELWHGTVIAAVLGLGLMVPAAPGYVGSYEFICVSVGAMFALSGEQALALALVMHAGVLVMTTVFGLASLAATTVRGARSPGNAPDFEPKLTQEAALHAK